MGQCWTNSAGRGAGASVTCTHEHASDEDPIVSLTVHWSPDRAGARLVLSQCENHEPRTLLALRRVMVQGLTELGDEGAQHE